FAQVNKVGNFVSSLLVREVLLLPAEGTGDFSHVLVAMLGPRLILLEAVPVPVAIAVDPLQAAQYDVFVVGEEQVISKPFPGLVQRNDVEDGRVGRAVIGRVRDAAEISQFPPAEFVRDLAPPDTGES